MFAYKKEKEQLKSLPGIPKAREKCAVNSVSCVFKEIDIRNLTELDITMYAVAAYFSELVGAYKLSKTKKEPWWKRRQLEGKLKELNRDLNYVYLRKEILRTNINISWKENTKFGCGAKIERSTPELGNINRVGQFLERLSHDG